MITTEPRGFTEALCADHCGKVFPNADQFAAHLRPAYAEQTRVRAKSCHCGKRYRPAPGEVCSLCHYAPLTAAELRKLPRAVKMNIRDVANGRVDGTTESVLAAHGLIIRSDYRAVGKAVDAF